MIVVDDDIDQAISISRSYGLWQPAITRTEGAIPDQYIFPLVAYLSAEEKSEAVCPQGSSIMPDPFLGMAKERQPVEASLRGYPKELQEQVLKNWEEYGFKKD